MFAAANGVFLRSIGAYRSRCVAMIGAILFGGDSGASVARRVKTLQELGAETTQHLSAELVVVLALVSTASMDQHSR